jgi:hypothetical protein
MFIIESACKEKQAKAVYRGIPVPPYFFQVDVREAKEIPACAESSTEESGDRAKVRG